jgi:hypothetical protein
MGRLTPTHASLAHIDQVWGCSNCTRLFMSEGGIKSHCGAKWHRSRGLLWVCNVCRMIYGSEESRRVHTCVLPEDKIDETRPVGCNFCKKRFKTPSAYAQHLESGVHRFNRHQVTQAVEALGIVPQITVAPTITLPTMASRIEVIPEDPTAPDAALTSTVPGPPLGNREQQAGTVIAVEPSNALIASHVDIPAHLGSHPQVRALATSTPPAMRIFVPDDFANVGIPYSCTICTSTFRTVASLTAHMNSPVHDPDAFMCPGCDRHFAVVSGLIQHLESGTCKLASAAEIFAQFMQVTSRFARFLTV